MQTIKCQKCNGKFKWLYRWFGFNLCNPCISDTLERMKEAGVID